MGLIIVGLKRDNCKVIHLKDVCFKWNEVNSKKLLHEQPAVQKKSNRWIDLEIDSKSIGIL